MQCPWGCGLLEEGICKSCSFKFQWLLECGWKQESSKVYMVKKRNSTRWIGPTREFRDCLCINADTGGIFSDKELPSELTKWNKRNKVMKSDQRNEWYYSKYSYKIHILINKRNITSKKRRGTSREERREKKKSKVGPTSLSMEKVEKIEQRMEIVDILTCFTEL